MTLTLPPGTRLGRPGEVIAHGTADPPLPGGTVTEHANPAGTITAQAVGLAFPDVPGFGGQGWSTQETALAVKWLFTNPAAWDQAMDVARAYPGNPHTVADTLHEQIVPRTVLEGIAGDGGDPAKVNWLEVAHELIERRDDPRPAGGIAGQIAGLATDMADGEDTIPGPVPDDPVAVAMYTAHRLDDCGKHLSHASERLDAARKTADAGLRGITWATAPTTSTGPTPPPTSSPATSAPITRRKAPNWTR